MGRDGMGWDWRLIERVHPHIDSFRAVSTGTFHMKSEWAPESLRPLQTALDKHSSASACCAPFVRGPDTHTNKQRTTPGPNEISGG